MTDLRALFQDMSLQTILRHLSQLPGVISVEMTLADGKKLFEVSDEITQETVEVTNEFLKASNEG
jgi:roadblock/LC7 domain-containing protein